MLPDSARQFILWAGDAADGYLTKIFGQREKIEVPPSRPRPAP